MKSFLFASLLLWHAWGSSVEEQKLVGRCLERKSYDDEEGCSVRDMVCTKKVEISAAKEYVKEYLTEEGGWAPLLGHVHEDVKTNFGTKPFVAQWMTKDDVLQTSVCVTSAEDPVFTVLHGYCDTQNLDESKVEWGGIFTIAIENFTKLLDEPGKSYIMVRGKWQSGNKMFLQLSNDKSGEDLSMHIEFQQNRLLFNDRKDGDWGNQCFEQGNDYVKKDQDFYIVILPSDEKAQVYTVDEHGRSSRHYTWTWRQSWKDVGSKTKVIVLEAEENEKIAVYSANIVKAAPETISGKDHMCHSMQPLNISNRNFELVEHYSPCTPSGQVMYKKMPVEEICQFHELLRGKDTEYEDKSTDKIEVLAPYKMSLRCSDEHALDTDGTRIQQLKCYCNGSASDVKACTHYVAYKESETCGPDPEFRDHNISEATLSSASCYHHISAFECAKTPDPCAVLYFYAPVEVTLTCNGAKCEEDQVKKMCGSSLNLCKFYLTAGPVNARHRRSEHDPGTDQELSALMAPDPRSWHPFTVSAQVSKGWLSSAEVHRVHSEKKCDVCNKLDLAVFIKKVGESTAARATVWCTQTIPTIQKGSWQEMIVELPMMECTANDNNCPTFKFKVMVLIAYTKAPGSASRICNPQSTFYDCHKWKANIQELLRGIKDEAKKTYKSDGAIFCDDANEQV